MIVERTGINPIPVKKGPPYKKGPPIRYKNLIGGGLSYVMSENFGDLELKMMIFIRKNVSERCKMAKFSACGGLEALK